MKKKISVVGVGLSAEDLSVRAQKIITAADVLAGGRRLLDYFPGHTAQKIVLDRNVEATLRKLKTGSRGKKIVVLASGDPNFFGVSPLVIAVFGKERVCVVPNITAFQGAFARARERWDDAAFISLHGRDISGLEKIFLAEGPAVVYCDDKNTPAAVARWLIAAEPRAAQWKTRVFENLGQPDERISAGALENISAPPVCAAYHDDYQCCSRRTMPTAAEAGLGIGDEHFHHDRGMITKRDVRLLSLARLACGNGRVLWDIGAGSGSVCDRGGASLPGHAGICG